MNLISNFLYFILILPVIIWSEWNNVTFFKKIITRCCNLNDLEIIFSHNLSYNYFQL